MGMSPRDILMYVIGFFLAGIVLPIGIGTIFNATTTNWDASVKLIFQVVFPIIAVLGLSIKFIGSWTGGK